MQARGFRFFCMCIFSILCENKSHHDVQTPGNRTHFLFLFRNKNKKKTLKPSQALQFHRTSDAFCVVKM